MERNWDYTTDWLVAGSGGGGMTSAIVAKDRGQEVLLIEKGSLYGGSTAMSGGTIWVPGNHLMGRKGIQDSSEEAIAYLKAITAGRVPDHRLHAYVVLSSEMTEYLEDRSHVCFRIVPGYSDYYPHLAGSKPGGGRTLEPEPFNARKLGQMWKDLRPLPRQARLFGRMMATAYDAHLMMDTSLRGRLKAAALFIRYFLNPARSLYRTDTRLTLGNALVGRLRLSLADRKISVWLNAAGRNLIQDGDRVAGLEVETPEGTKLVKARSGVLLAAGGFARNRAMRHKFQRQPVSDAWTVACPEDEGDAVRMGIEVAAALDFMDDAWWMPTTLSPGGEMPNMIIVERSLPGSIIVNARGRRFVDEAAAYIDVVKAQYSSHLKDGGAIPAYLIVDERFRRKYPLSPMLPGAKPDKYIRNGYLKVGQTLEELATKCGIDAEGLIAEVKKFNEFCVDGVDLDYRRGGNEIDRYYGDPAVRPNACLGPLDSPPFYAVELWPGDLGTKGGMVTDANGRVLREDGSPVEGLYATGNCSASVMGGSYAGAGATIGPSMVFGYASAVHAAGMAEKTHGQR